MKNREATIGAALICVSAALWGVDGVVLTPRLSNLSVPFVVFLLHAVPFALMQPFLWQQLPPAPCHAGEGLDGARPGRFHRRTARHHGHRQGAVPGQLQPAQRRRPAAEAAAGLCPRPGRSAARRKGLGAFSRRRGGRSRRRLPPDLRALQPRRPPATRSPSRRRFWPLWPPPPSASPRFSGRCSWGRSTSKMPPLPATA